MKYLVNAFVITVGLAVLGYGGYESSAFVALTGLVITAASLGATVLEVLGLGDRQ